MNHEFLITAIPGITIVSCSVSCCLAEVCPRRKFWKNLLILQLNLKEVQRRKQIWRHGKKGTGLCPQQGQCELSAWHVLKIIEHILYVHCVLLLIFNLFQILSHFINLFLTSFGQSVSFRTNASIGFSGRNPHQLHPPQLRQPRI